MTSSELIDLKAQLGETQRMVDELREETAGLPARWRVNMGGQASLPTGQYQGMVFMMVTQVESGFDFPQAHSLP